MKSYNKLAHNWYKLQLTSCTPKLRPYLFVIHLQSTQN